MDQARDETTSQAPLLALEAIRIAEQSARAAERSAAGALATLERAESSLQASEDRMVEITAAASSAASEATEARLRATEIATEFRSLEERVSRALRIDVARQPDRLATPVSSDASAEPPTGGDSAMSDSRRTAPVVPESNVGGTTAEFEALWDSFDRKADRIVRRLKEIEARTMTVIRAPMPQSHRSETQAERHP